MQTRSQSGFTLIEVMITVAIIGILVAIAVPSYTQYVQRTRRNECAGVMISMANALERRFTQTNAYNTGGALGGFSCPADGGTATYNLAINPLTATTYSINAVPTGPQAGDSCGTLTLSQTGLKGSALTIDRCWR